MTAKRRTVTTARRDDIGWLTRLGPGLVGGTIVLVVMVLLSGGWLPLPFGASATTPPGATAQKSAQILILRPETAASGAPVTNIWAIRADGTGLRRVTDESEAVLDFAVSPDGSHLIYVARDGLGATALWRIGSDGAGRTRVSPPADPAVYSDPAWSPAGDVILYTRRDLIYPGSPIGAVRPTSSSAVPAVGVPRIWAMTADGITRRKVYGVGDDEGEVATWSPNGAVVAFRAGNGTQLMTEVAMTDLTHDPVIVPTRTISHVSWSPDGGWLAYDEIGPNNKSRIALIRADGTGKRPLFADSSASDTAPTWSPDGTRLAFLRPPQEGQPADAVSVAFEVWTATQDGQLGRRLLGGDGRASEGLVWSPGGQMLAATRYTVSGVAARGVWIVGADGSGARELLADATHPTWIPRE